jgi:dihydrofolate reductase
MSRRVRYQVAVSLDGFLARPDGSYDWIVDDRAIDLEALFREFDTVVMGRKTHELMISQGGTGAMPGAEVIVFSRTLRPSRTKGLRITGEDPGRVIAALKKKRGKDIWLFGGGSLFHALLAAKQVDTVELAVMPVLLGVGIPLLPPGVETKLRLTDHRILPKSGIAVLAYQVEGGSGAPPAINFVKRGSGARTASRSASSASGEPGVKKRKAPVRRASASSALSSRRRRRKAGRQKARR